MNPNKSDANRLALALKNIHSEENLYKVPFFLGDKFADWHFKNAKEDQAAFEKHCSEHNIRLGLLGNEQSELYAALKALYQEMIDKRTALVKAAYAQLHENEIEPIQTPNFSISTKYAMPVPAYNAIPVIVQVAVKAVSHSAPSSPAEPEILNRRLSMSEIRLKTVDAQKAREQAIYETVKDMPYNDRIELMIARPIKTRHGGVNMSATARAYGIVYKDAQHRF